MTIKELDSYVGKQVKVVLFDGTELKGELTKSVMFRNKYMLPEHTESGTIVWYFRVSHIKKFEVLK